MWCHALIIIRWTDYIMVCATGLKTYRVLPLEKALVNYKETNGPLISSQDYTEMVEFRSLVKEIIPYQDGIVYKEQL